MLENREDIVYGHPLITQVWGQKRICFYDPDYHIIEVSENKAVQFNVYIKKG